ncbi:hypothetical protein GCM10010346_57520 [Streptomyces chryseus]|uniref:Uncharacterized protein n=1 Tax=Streptomyces chryseus TaxID=68186 RepID=A0ABQ3E7Z9_9ACTN|nr:hypothetical protein GCM10010346_57520 [Streptomyces chryseus]
MPIGDTSNCGATRLWRTGKNLALLEKPARDKSPDQAPFGPEGDGQFPRDQAGGTRHPGPPSAGGTAREVQHALPGPHFLLIRAAWKARRPGPSGGQPARTV